jgi:hypothetical protein
MSKKVVYQDGEYKVVTEIDPVRGGWSGATDLFNGNNKIASIEYDPDSRAFWILDTGDTGIDDDGSHQGYDELKDLVDYFKNHELGQGVTEMVNKNRKRQISLLSLYERAGQDNMFDKEFQYTKEERNAFMEAVKNYSEYGKIIYRSKQLADCVKEISELVELAGGFTLKETDGWFDNVTATRHTKQMKEAMKVLQKETQEIMARQQRLEAAYEDIGTLFGRYYDV